MMKTRFLLGFMLILLTIAITPFTGYAKDSHLNTEYSIDVQQPIQSEMNSLLEYRDVAYFAENKDSQFLVKTAAGFRITTLTIQQSNWWFDFDGYKIKSTSAPSISFNQLRGTPVLLKEDERLYGRISLFGLNNTDIIHVYWDYTMAKFGRIFGNSIPRPYGFQRLIDLRILPK